MHNMGSGGRSHLYITEFAHLSRHSLKSTLWSFSKVEKTHLSRHFQPAAGENFEGLEVDFGAEMFRKT